MEKWTVQKYFSPYLNIQSVAVHEDSAPPFLLLDTHQGEFELTVESSAQSIGEIATWLRELRSHASPAWNGVRRGDSSDAEQKILEQADQLSLIEEYRQVEDFSVRSDDINQIESDIRAYSGLLRQQIVDSTLKVDIVSNILGAFKEVLGGLLGVDLDRNKISKHEHRRIVGRAARAGAGRHGRGGRPGAAVPP